MAKAREMARLQLDRHGRVVIPVACREALNLKAGDRLVAYVEEGRLVIRPRADLIRELRETFRLKPGEESMVKTLRKMRDEEVAREIKR